MESLPKREFEGFKRLSAIVKLRTIKKGGPPYNNRFNTDSAWPSRPLLVGQKRSVLSTKVAPEPPSACPFQARQKGATASRVNRALYGRDKGSTRF
jgi:hypothetical protein